MVLDVSISKFLDSSFIDVDVHPTYITITIKNNILQLVLEEPVITSQVVCERSRLTGNLLVTMLKQGKDGDIVDLTRKLKKSDFGIISVEKKPVPLSGKNRRYERLDFDPKEAVDIKNIVSESSMKYKTTTSLSSSLNKIKILDSKHLPSDFVNKKVEEEEFIDNPDVPPLC